MRLTIFTPRFNRRRVALVTSREIARALARCIVALGREPLPGPGDYEAMMPPTAVYWVRRVLGANLWIWFAFDDERLYLVHLGGSPPIPMDDT